SPFDFVGKYFSVKGAYCSPASIQPGGPPLISAAFSLPGQGLCCKILRHLVHDYFKRRQCRASYSVDQGARREIRTDGPRINAATRNMPPLDRRGRSLLSSLCSGTCR